MKEQKSLVAAGSTHLRSYAALTAQRNVNQSRTNARVQRETRMAAAEKG